MNQVVRKVWHYGTWPLRYLKARLWKNPKKSIGDFLWARHEKRRAYILSQVPAEKMQKIKSELPQKMYTDGSVVTITFGSRAFGNRDNKLTLFLDSFIEFTHQLDRIEILIKVDDDDDLPFFYNIKQRYTERGVNIRIFPTPRGRGYEDMHIWHHELIQYRNVAAKVHYILTDDAVFEVKDWDDKLMSMLEKRNDTYFIATSCSLELAIKTFGPYPVKPIPVYWIRGDDYPIYGFDLLKSAAKAVVDFPDWNEFGNLQLVDQYAGALLKVALNKYHVNLHEEIDLYAVRKGVHVSWDGDPKRSEIRTRTLLKFHNEESQRQREKVVEQIISDMNRQTGN